MRARVPLSALILSILAAPLTGQPLADRIAGVRDGTIRMSFATRSLVCGNGEFIGFDLPDAFHTYTIWRDGYSVNVNQDVRPACQTGPLRLVVERSGGRVTDLRAAVGVAWRPSATAVDLGMVSAPAAAEWLVDLAEQGNGDVARIALLAAAAADSTPLTDRVLGLARNQRLTADTRVRAMRWAGVVGATEGRTADVDAAFRAMAADDAEPVAVRERAIRELSGTPRNRAHLRSLYGQIRETGLRERILREVAAGGGDAEATWLRQVALDGSAPLALRERAIRLLGDDLGRTADVRALYAELTDRALRERALRVAADRDVSGTRDWIRRVAEDREEDSLLRERAVRLLAEQEDLAYLRALYPRLELLGLRERVIRLVAERDDAAAAAWLRDIVLDDGEQSELRDRAARSLDEAGVASQELATLYDRVTSRAVRSRLIRVLADRRDQVAAEKLAAIATGDPDAGLRREAERRQR